MLEIVIHEVLWSIRGSYSAIWSFPLTNVKWHSDPWPTVTSQPITLSTNFMTLISTLTFTESCVNCMEYLQRVWHASRERLPFRTPASASFPHFGVLLVLQLLRPDFSNLPCLYSTFHLEYPLVLSRFCFAAFSQHCSLNSVWYSRRSFQLRKHGIVKKQIK